MIDNPTCTCNEGHQTPDHLIYECKLLLAQRSSLVKHIMIRGGVWPSTHNELVTTYLNAFAKVELKVNKHVYLCHLLVLSSPTLMMHGHMNLKHLQSLLKP